MTQFKVTLMVTTNRGDVVYIDRTTKGEFAHRAGVEAMAQVKTDYDTIASNIKVVSIRELQ